MTIKLTTFTVIMGSAYHDATEQVYIADAVDAQTVCAYVSRIARAQNDSLKSVMYCFEGIVKFCPTIFEMGVKAYVPEAIDLRGPGTAKLAFMVDGENFVYITTNEALEAIMPLAGIVAELREHNVIVEYEDAGQIKARAYYGTGDRFTQRHLIHLNNTVSSHKAIVDVPARCAPADPYTRVFDISFTGRSNNRATDAQCMVDLLTDQGFEPRGITGDNVVPVRLRETESDDVFAARVKSINPDAVIGKARMLKNGEQW